MTLIKSISGIRGTIGGKPGDGLTPIDIVKFTAAFGQLIRAKNGNTRVVIGRDARPSGEALNQLVVQTLIMSGFDVLDLGLSTTPTVEIAVPLEEAGGGIILTASHCLHGKKINFAVGNNILYPPTFPPLSVLQVQRLEQKWTSTLHSFTKT